MIELIYSLNELNIVVSEKIIPKIKSNIVCFEGKMGSGKTTFINSICKNLKVKDNISSPTFSLINEYRTFKGDIIYHFDFYRVKNEKEALNLGIEEYFYSSKLCLIEWGSNIEILLPKDKHQVCLDYINNKQRKLTFK